LPDQPAVLVVVVAAVGDHRVRASARPSNTASHRRHPVEQLEELGDVVAVAAGQPPAAIDRAGTGLRAPFFACT
jgi:hypothetical protein